MMVGREMGGNYRISPFHFLDQTVEAEPHRSIQTKRSTRLVMVVSRNFQNGVWKHAKPQSEVPVGLMEVASYHYKHAVKSSRIFTSY